MHANQTELLRTLTIDRAQRAPSTGHRTWSRLSAAGGIGLVVVLVTCWGSAYRGLFSDTDVARPMEVTAAQMSGGSSQTSESSSPKTRADNLVASGYVVARRKSTLGSEVTARIVTIFADEGDSVQAGQVVATLDSVLAKS